MELMENFIRIVLGLALMVSFIVCARKKIRYKWPILAIIVIVFIKVVDVFLIKLLALENLLLILSSGLLLAPISYLYLLSFKNSKLSKGTAILHLLVPLIITFAMLYNLYFSSEENIMVTILVNLISAIVVLIYGSLIMFKSQTIYDLLANGGKRSFYSFFLFLSLFLIIESLVSIVSVLYFSDDLLLVNLSVDVPKTYDTHFYFTLLVLLGITLIYHSWDKVKK